MSQATLPCIKLERFSPFRYYFAFMDVKDARSPSVFLKHGMRPRIKDAFFRKGTDYAIVFCSIRKKDEAAFAEAIQEHSRNLYLLGYDDYLSYWDEFVATLGHTHP